MKKCSIVRSHMKKRLMTLVVAFCLVLGLVPMTAFAEAGDWDPTRSASEIVSNDIRSGDSSTASTTKYLGAGDIQLKIMPTLRDGNTTYNAMAYCGVTVVSSNPNVADIAENNSVNIGKWQGGGFNGADALQITLEPKGIGTTVVTTTFYYTFSQKSMDPVKNPNAVWFKGTHRYTVQVKDLNEKPAGPTEADAENFWDNSDGAVYIWCNVNWNGHSAVFEDLTEVPNGYSFGEVVKNDGRNTNAPVDSYPWMCIMTVDHNAYLNAYNATYAGTYGTHYLKNPEITTTEIAWFNGDNGWVYQASNAPIYIDVVHDRVSTEYTVTYTDGVENEEVFADDVHSNLELNSATPAFRDGTPTRDGYVFKGWNPEVAATVTGDATYVATWGEDKNNNGIDDNEETKYTVTYTDGVETEEVFADQVYAGLLSGSTTPTFNGGTPTRDGYVFKGWNPEVAATVTGDVTYVATWGEDKNNNGIDDNEETKYTVTYTDGVETEEVFADQVYAGLLSGSTTPAFNGGTPTRDGYVFKGWNPEVTATVTGDVTYVAVWEEDKDDSGNGEETKYTVTYTDGVDGEEVFADQVYSDLVSGSATPAFVGTPTRTGYVFKGWNPKVTETVTGNATYVATWAEDKNNNGIADDEEDKPEKPKPSDPTNPGDTKPGDGSDSGNTTTPADTKTSDTTKLTNTQTNNTTENVGSSASNSVESEVKSPTTGETSNIFLWLAMIFGSAAFGTAIVNKKKKIQ